MRLQLREVLPEYMVPSAFVLLSRFPVTANGKLDKRALPLPSTDVYSGRYEAPQGEVEERVANLWSKLLHVDRVGRRDNYFELGGHSLNAVNLVSQIDEHFGVKLSTTSVFKYPTVEELSGAVKSMQVALQVSSNIQEEIDEGVI